MRALILATAIGALASTSLWAAAPNEAPATLHVVLPENAILTVNGAKTTSTSSDRWFVTPNLESGKSYVCTLKAEFVRDGQKVQIERRVLVQAGSEKSVMMDLPASRNAVYRSFYEGPGSAPVLRPMPVIQDRSYDVTNTPD